MYPLVAKKWTNQKSDLAIQIASQKEAYPEKFINIGLYCVCIRQVKIKFDLDLSNAYTVQTDVFW